MSEPPPPASVPPPVPTPAPSTGGPEPDVAPRWGPKRVFAGLAAFLVLVLLEAAIVVGVDGDSDDLSLAATLTLQALLAVTLVVVAFVAARPDSGETSAADLGLRRPLHPAVKAAALAYVAYIGCALLIAAIVQPEQEDVTRDLGADEGAFGSIAAGFLVIVAAPITEEVFFRGFMFAGLRRAMPFAGAALLSAAIWGVFHYTGGGSWGVVLQLGIFGVALAWLYERTGSIWPTIAVHALNNALAFAILTS